MLKTIRRIQFEEKYLFDFFDNIFNSCGVGKGIIKIFFYKYSPPTETMEDVSNLF